MAKCQIQISLLSWTREEIEWARSIIEHRFGKGQLYMYEKYAVLEVYIEGANPSKDFKIFIDPYDAVNQFGEIEVRHAAVLQGETLTDDIIRIYNDFQNEVS